MCRLLIYRFPVKLLVHFHSYKTFNFYLYNYYLFYRSSKTLTRSIEKLGYSYLSYYKLYFKPKMKSNLKLRKFWRTIVPNIIFFCKFIKHIYFFLLHVYISLFILHNVIFYIENFLFYFILNISFVSLKSFSVF